METKNGCKKSQAAITNSLYFQHKEAFTKGTRVRNWPYDPVNARVISFAIKGKCGSKEIKEKWYGYYTEQNIFKDTGYYLIGPKRPNLRIHVQRDSYEALWGKERADIYGTGLLIIDQISPTLFKAWGAGCHITGQKVN